MEGDRIDRRSLTQSFYWRVDSARGKVPIDDNLDWANDLQDLISICSHKAAGFEFVQLLHPDVYHQLPENRMVPAPIDMFTQWNVRSERPPPRLYGPDFLFTFEDFGGMEGIRRWMNVAEEHRTSFGRVAATRYARNMFVSDRLLNCTAALEGLDRTVTGHSNSKLKTRLTRCSSLAGQPFSGLVGDIASWMEAIRLDRDDVAHHFGRRTRSSSIQTFYLWESLYFLYILCILRLCDSPEDVFTHLQEHAAYRQLAERVQMLEIFLNRHYDDPRRSHWLFVRGAGSGRLPGVLGRRGLRSWLPPGFDHDHKAARPLSVCTLMDGRTAWAWGSELRAPAGDQPGVDRLVDWGAKFQCNQRFRRYRACCLCR